MNMKKIILKIKKIFYYQKFNKGIEFSEIFKTTSEKGLINTIENHSTNEIQLFFFPCNTNYLAKPICLSKKDAFQLSKRLKMQAKSLKN